MHISTNTNGDTTNTAYKMHPKQFQGQVYSEKCQCEHMTELLNEQLTFAAEVTRERETKEAQTHTK